MERNTLRIIAGTLRGRVLHFPSLAGLRPTPNRVRETLFNYLMHDIVDATVLDLFSGSGALGLEALSRGAKKVIFVEKSKLAAAEIQKHLENFHLSPSRYELHQKEASDYLNSLPSTQTFNLMFIDPPFGQGLLKPMLAKSFSHLASGGKIHIEHEIVLKPETYLPEGARVLKDNTAGELRYLLLTSGAL